MNAALISLWIIFAHWVADFVCQSHWMAANKSKDWNALGLHVAVYTLVMGALVFSWLRSADAYFWCMVITATAHFATDAITSRITAPLFAKQNWHWFFVVVGFDQFLHYAQLFLMFAWLPG